MGQISTLNADIGQLRGKYVTLEQELSKTRQVRLYCVVWVCICS